MGSWRLEVGKMFLYVMFPVGAFHYFNQPEIFKKWIEGNRVKTSKITSENFTKRYTKLKEEYKSKIYEKKKQELEF